jgi:hypothetical protein
MRLGGQFWEGERPREPHLPKVFGLARTLTLPQKEHGGDLRQQSRPAAWYMPRAVHFIAA